MIPQIANVPTPAPAASANSTAQETKAPQAPISTPVARTELAQAVPAVARPPETSAPSKETRRNLNPPDPNAPAGPPPSFEASILDRAREEAANLALDQEADPTQPEAVDASEQPDAVDASEQPPELSETLGDPDPADAALNADASSGASSPDALARDDERPVAEPLRDPYAAPPTPSARVETEVATVRLMEAPAARPEVDRSI